MADKDELDLDTSDSKSGGNTKLIILSIVLSLIISGAVIGALFVTGVLGSGGGGDTADAEQPKQLVLKPAFYINLGAPFIVNFETDTMATYLQIEMQLLARDQSVSDVVNKNIPVIRNNILLIMSAQSYETVKDRGGKEKLQAEILDEVKKIVGEAMAMKLDSEQGGKHSPETVPNIEQVYFTSFVMQ